MRNKDRNRRGGKEEGGKEEEGRREGENFRGREKNDEIKKRKEINNPLPN